MALRPHSLDLHAAAQERNLGCCSAWSQALLLSKRWVPAAFGRPRSRAPGFETLHLGQSPGPPRHVQEMEQKSLVTETTHMLGKTKRPCLRRHHLRGPTTGSCPASRWRPQPGQPRPVPSGALQGGQRGGGYSSQLSRGIPLALPRAPGLLTTILHTDNTASIINATGTMDNI